MGSKTPDFDGRRDNYRSPIPSNTICNVEGEPRGSHTSTDGDGCLGGEGSDEDGDGDGKERETSLNIQDNQEQREVLEALGTPKKQNKKKKKKKKHKSDQATKQNPPPKVLLSDLFPAGNYPKGEIQSYAKPRIAADEARYNIRLATRDGAFLPNYRKAAEAHRQARRWVHENVKPGCTLLQIANGIEDSVRAALGHAGLETGDCLKAGMGFPTGLCLNNQTAHYTPNPGQKDVILKQEDVMKVDFGVHINGWIVDSAFTMTFDPTYDNLLAAVKDATDSGIKAAGVDVRICDISEAIQEAMESYEVEIQGKTIPVKAVRNITAHNIKQYRIHGGKSIPFVKNSDNTKLEEGEVIAIETFGTTGCGYLHDDVGVYGYGLNHNTPLTKTLPLSSTKRLHKTIRENFGTLVFCRRYLERLGVERYLAGMSYLISNGIVECYGPLADDKGSYSAQFEHTLILGENQKEILSRGEDY